MMLRIKKIKHKLFSFRLDIRSVTIYRCIILLVLLPIILALFAWGHGWVTHDTSDWSIKMMEKALYILEKATTPSVVAFAVTLIPKWPDKDENGISDADEKKEGANNGARTNVMENQPQRPQTNDLGRQSRN